ncbi:3-isopropylmalate dehydratase large subunit [Pseudomonas sp. MUP55]|uniref:3-isopropylmalate dehydratase large subunit n=1 Tax=Pseudomonas sp. MUP55 TaxID=3087234 RepID=UPI002A5ADC83|nr:MULTISPECIES: 3-isopropylmalate dehydratase large subunit [unclassified Pseudomonas]WPN92774.1 3-isopropylmalate dehydratase large subunit [Pseudomonas sp. MUP56]WPN98300.1 3-isopropylmalate dehydratase large subunit [Pseudomonas sp. MUP55]
MSSPKTLYQKHIDSHTVCSLDEQGHVLLYIDRQVVNEYTSPQAFSGLREAGRPVWRPGTALAVVDHVNPTAPERTAVMPDAGGARQVSYLSRNCQDFGIELLDILDKRQGIEHVIAPEQGFILPGMVIAAGDSHTTTYGALGAFGFGIGTSEIEHLLASQTLVYKRLRTMRVRVVGALSPGLTSKDVIMALIGQIGASGATGFAIEFVGSTIDALSVEARMTMCNMAVEAGARGAFMAPDQKVFDYLEGKPRAPKGEQWRRAVAVWRNLHSDEGAVFDHEVTLDVSRLLPMVTWGTSPDQVVAINGRVPDPLQVSDLILRRDMQRALTYMGLKAGEPLNEVVISHAFIGSCTNARIEDLRDAARVIGGRRVAPHVRAMVVPGSTEVRDQAEAEGLAAIFRNAGFEWRQSGCSMCLAMNDDVLAPGDRCASSTNRNFEGRQGAGARTHLMSPAMVAAAAISGHLTDVRQIGERV